MGARGEVIQTAAPWSRWFGVYPPAWLLGYIRTDVPGYRELEVDGLLYVADSGEYRADQIATAFSTLPHSLTVFDGRTLPFVYIDDPTTLAFPDRLGSLLGFGIEAGLDAGAKHDAQGLLGSDFFAARFISPAAIPLRGYTWQRVDNEADRQQLIDQYRRNQGYVWGEALLWRCVLRMDRYGFEALQVGWLLNGKVTLGGTDMIDSPIDTSNPKGAITGYVLGPAPESLRWIDPTQEFIELEIIIVTEN